MLRQFPLILKNALRNKRRSLLNILSISISICLLAVLLALYYSFFLRPASTDQALRLITIHRVSITNVLPAHYEQRIAQVPGVKVVMPMNWFGGEYKDGRDVRNMFARFSVDPRKVFDIYPEWAVTPDVRAAFLRDQRGCIVGRALANRLGMKPGDRVHIKGDIFNIDLDLIVSGIYDSSRDNENLLFHHKYLEEGIPWFKNFSSMFIVRANDGENIERVARSVDEVFRNSTAETKTDTERAFEASFLSYLGDVKLFMVAVCLALTFTILLVSANTMAMSARERVREIGVLRTLGFNKQHILVLLIGEAVFLSIIGGVLGLLLASFVVGGLRTLPSVFVDLRPVAVTPALTGVCLAVAAFVGVFSSLLPAWSASRLPITQTLRKVD